MPRIEFFTNNLYKINKIINKVINTLFDNDKITALIRAKFLAKYSSYKDVFSKVVLDTLVLYRLYNYKIVLTELLPNNYSPLY